jgi:hypothetical protein
VPLPAITWFPQYTAYFGNQSVHVKIRFVDIIEQMFSGEIIQIVFNKSGHSQHRPRKSMIYLQHENRNIVTREISLDKRTFG